MQPSSAAAQHTSEHVLASAGMEAHVQLVAEGCSCISGDDKPADLLDMASLLEGDCLISSFPINNQLPEVHDLVCYWCSIAACAALLAMLPAGHSAIAQQH